MELFLPAAYSLLFLIVVLKTKFFQLKELSRIKLAGLFIIKLMASSAVWMIYTWYYEASDFHYYFSDSEILIEHLFGDTSRKMQCWDANFEPVMFNNSRTMIVVNALLRIFSFGNIYVHLVFFCFFSFIGLVALYKAFCRTFPGKEIRLAVSIFLVPTVLFWGSAPLKETLVIGIMGILIHISDFGLKLRLPWWQIMFILFLFILLFYVKVYIALAMLPVLLVNSIVSETSERFLLFKYLSVFLGLAILALYINIANPDYNLLQLISQKQGKAIAEAKGGVFLANDRNFICVDHAMKEKILVPQPDSSFRIREGSYFMSWKLDNMKDTTFVISSTDTARYRILYEQVPAKSILEMKRMKPELLSFILYAPQAMFNVIIHPTIFETDSWLHLGVAIENMWILLLIMLVLIFFDRSSVERKEVLFFCFVFSAILFMLIGYTVPALGAMIRYRTVGLLLFVPLCTVMIDADKIQRRWRMLSGKM